MLERHGVLHYDDDDDDLLSHDLNRDLNRDLSRKEGLRGRREYLAPPPFLVVLASAPKKKKIYIENLKKIYYEPHRTTQAGGRL